MRDRKPTATDRLAAVFAATMFVFIHAVLFDVALASAFVKLEHERFGAEIFYQLLPFAALRLPIP
jgi:hypothetical protein